MSTSISRSRTSEEAIVVAVHDDGAYADKDMVGMLILVVIMIVVLLLRSGSLGG